MSRDHDTSLDHRTKNGAGAPARAGIAAITDTRGDLEKTAGYIDKEWSLSPIDIDKEMSPA